MKHWMKKTFSGLLVFVSLVVMFSGAVSLKFGRGETPVSQIEANFSVRVGEVVDIETFIGFDEDETYLLSAEVRKAEDNSRVELTDLTFVPETAGYYKVTLVKESEGRVYSSYYYIEAEYSEEAVVLKEPVFPHAFIAGETYTLRAPVAYVYSRDGAKREADFSVSVSYDGKREEIGENLSYTPSVKRSGDTVCLQYVLKGNNARETTYTYEIPVVVINSASGLLTENLFVCNLIDAIKTEKSYLTAYTSSDNATMAFCNPIPADNFRIRWKMSETYNNFDELIVVLEDYENKNEKAELAFGKADEENSYLSINGGPKYTVETSFVDGSFTIEYRQSKRNISDSNGVIASVEQLPDGKPFGGFSSGIVKVSLRFSGVRGYSAVSFSHMGNQALAGIKKDSISPYIFFTDEVRVRYEQGENIKINKAFAYDVLDPSATVSVSVYKLNEDGSVSDEEVCDAEGVPIKDYDCSEAIVFAATDICRYRVEYTAKDWNNRLAVTTYIYTVNDSLPPEVQFGEMAKTGSIGNPIKLPEISYTDNNGTENVKVLITYLSPSNVLETLPEGSISFVPNQTGVYKIRFFVYDSYYNYAVKDYTVEVK